MDVLKDRLYCDAAGSASRRSCQTVLLQTLDALVRLLAPILAHTAEEAWAAMEHYSQDCETVHLTAMPTKDMSIDFKADEAKWEELMSLRDEVLRVLEGLRQAKTIASNQEACVTIRCSDDLASLVEDFGIEQYAAFCIVSEVRLEKGAHETKVSAEKSSNAKCERCWNYWPSVGSDGEYPDICSRCADTVRQSSGKE
jgi:isoleucyl-tRNA synthetase